jgi:hypothetical protein
MIGASHDAGGVPPLYASFLKEGTFAALTPYAFRMVHTWKAAVVVFVHEFGFTPTPELTRFARALRGEVLFAEMPVTGDDDSERGLWTLRSLPVFVVISPRTATTHPVGHLPALVEHVWTSLRRDGALPLPQPGTASA